MWHGVKGFRNSPAVCCLLPAPIWDRRSIQATRHLPALKWTRPVEHTKVFTDSLLLRVNAESAPLRPSRLARLFSEGTLVFGEGSSRHSTAQ